jgi:hypothetical protein
VQPVTATGSEAKADTLVARAGRCIKTAIAVVVAQAVIELVPAASIKKTCHLTWRSWLVILFRRIRLAIRLLQIFSLSPQLLQANSD